MSNPRRIFGALETASPRLGARVAEHLWFRLPAAPSVEARARRAPAGGSPIIVRRNGITVRGVAYGPDDAPLAVLVHGWGGWWQQLAAHVEPLLAAGYRVVAYDAPSHGASPRGRHGRTTTAMEMADALDAVVRERGPAALVIAHSLGAMSTVWARETHGLGAGAYVFIAPGTSVAPMIDVFQQATGMGPKTRILFEHRLVRRFERPFEAFEVTTLTRRATAAGLVAPLLVIHDAHDPEVPAAGSRALTKVWPESDLVLTEGLGHRHVIWAPEVIERVAGFAASVSNFAIVGNYPTNANSPASRGNSGP